MHVHANYNLQLAVMGSNRDEVHELAARRAAEVRRRLQAAEKRIDAEDDVAFVKAASAVETEGRNDAYSNAEGEQQRPEALEIDQREHGSLFSALA